jgi:hypothetical protein
MATVVEGGEGRTLGLELLLRRAEMMAMVGELALVTQLELGLSARSLCRVGVASVDVEVEDVAGRTAPEGSLQSQN